MWNVIATITVSQDWQTTPVIAAELGYVRLSFSTANIPVWIAQIDQGSSAAHSIAIWNEQRINATSYAQILEFDAPPFFSDRALALRVPGFVIPFSVQVEVCDMPLSRASAGTSFVPSTTATETTVQASTTSVQLLAANPNRKGASVYNTASEPLYLAFGATATATTESLTLNSNDYYELPFGYTGIISGIWSGSTGSVLVTEFA